MTDYFSKWAEAYPLPAQTAESVTICLADWITRYGAPLQITSDRGANFVSQVVALFCKLWNVEQHYSSAYHPQANGLVERFNATLVDMLRAFSLESGAIWDEFLNACLFAYRTSFHTSTNTSPDLLVFGQGLKLPLDTEIARILHHEHSSPSDPSFVFSHAQALLRAREQAQQFMDKYKARYEEKYNRSHIDRAFNVGDVVFAKIESKDNKLSSLWAGPYKVFAKP
jgi:transposase InsO family protein